MIPCKLSKFARISGRPNGDSPTGPIEEGYHIEGSFASLPEPGLPFYVQRTKRMDVEVDGVFRTSPVESVTRLDEKNYNIKTQNSIYRLEIL